MEGNPSVRSTPQLVLALLVIILGILFTLDNLDILIARDYLRFWPLALMALGTAKFFDSDRPAGQAVGVLFFAVGSLFLLRNLNVIHIHLAALWPVVLILIGAIMLWRVVTRDRLADADSESIVSAIAILRRRAPSTRSFAEGTHGHWVAARSI
jgi:predicted membrane protein